MIQFWEFCQIEIFEIWKFELNHITWATFGPFRTICSAHQFLGLGLGQKNSAQGRFGPVSFGPPLGLGQPWAKLVYRPGPIWAGPGQAQTHPYNFSLHWDAKRNNKAKNSLLQSKIQFEKFDVLLRRTSIGFLMNYNKIFTLSSKIRRPL